MAQAMTKGNIEKLWASTDDYELRVEADYMAVVPSVELLQFVFENKIDPLDYIDYISSNCILCPANWEPGFI